MTAEEYWNSEGIRMLNEDGTLPSVEQRVKVAFREGVIEGLVLSMNPDRIVERELFSAALKKVEKALKLKEGR